MSAELHIRTIEDGDVEEVVAIWREADLLRPWNDPRHDLAFARRNANSTVLVASRHGKLVGTVMVGHDGHRGWVYYVASDTTLRGQGVGRSIMHAAEHWLANQGVWKVQLLVRSTNQGAKGFYEKLGYVDTQSICFQKVLSTPS